MAVWVVVGLSVVGVVIAVLTAWQRRETPGDLGAVSNQWISEHRLDQGSQHRH